MQIGEVIRTFRKDKKLTQEEMARRLGVTAPAVNKWENGVSQPDISLLAPIARLLGITLETLLSFHEGLTTEEIAGIIQEIDREFETKPYGEVFRSAASLINEYPNCHQLIWQLAVVLHARCMADETTDCEEYETQIVQWYLRLLESNDNEIQRQAADSLFHYYLKKENYKEAGRYLSFFPEESAERKWMQANLYSKTGQIEEAFKTYEEILFSEYQMISSVMHCLFILSMEEHLWEQAEMWIGKVSGMATLFDMGRYYAQSCRLELAAYQKNVEETFSIVKILLDSIDQMCIYSESDMYAHMKFKPLGQSFYTRLRKDLMASFRNQETFGYMSHHDGWRRLLDDKAALIPSLPK